MHKTNSILAATEDAKFMRRFWAKVARRGPDDCWPWTAYRKPQGYGQIGGLGSPRRMFLAHRVAWASSNGQIPRGLCVMHSCDNPPCCNPEHLSIGTWKDNNRDKAAKGRNGGSILDESDVRRIRELYAAGGSTQRALAKQYGVAQTTISAIITGRSWSRTR